MNLRKWEQNSKSNSPAHIAEYFNMPFMSFNDFSNYRQSKAGAFLFRRKEWNEYIPALFRGNAASAIGHVKYEMRAPCTITDGDCCRCGRRLYGICKKIDILQKMIYKLQNSLKV